MLRTMADGCIEGDEFIFHFNPSEGHLTVSRSSSDRSSSSSTRNSRSFTITDQDLIWAIFDMHLGAVAREVVPSLKRCISRSSGLPLEQMPGSRIYSDLKPGTFVGLSKGSIFNIRDVPEPDWSKGVEANYEVVEPVGHLSYKLRHRRTGRTTTRLRSHILLPPPVSTAELPPYLLAVLEQDERGKRLENAQEEMMRQGGAGFDGGESWIQTSGVEPVQDSSPALERWHRRRRRRQEQQDLLLAAEMAKAEEQQNALNGALVSTQQSSSGTEEGRCPGHQSWSPSGEPALTESVEVREANGEVLPKMNSVETFEEIIEYEYEEEAPREGMTDKRSRDKFHKSSASAFTTFGWAA